MRLLGDPTRLLLACLNGLVSVGDIAESIESTVAGQPPSAAAPGGAAGAWNAQDAADIFHEVADEHIRSILADMIDHVREERARSASLKIRHA